jgi:hypothetical protein
VRTEPSDAACCISPWTISGRSALATPPSPASRGGSGALPAGRRRGHPAGVCQRSRLAHGDRRPSGLAGAESRLLVDVGRAARHRLRQTSGPILRRPRGCRAPRLRARISAARRLRWRHAGDRRVRRADPARSRPLSPSRFYLATGRYFILRTCNTWTAAALRAAGLPINPTSVVTARQVMNEARSLGTMIGGP